MFFSKKSNFLKKVHNRSKLSKKLVRGRSDDFDFFNPTLIFDFFGRKNVRVQFGLVFFHRVVNEEIDNTETLSSHHSPYIVHLFIDHFLILLKDLIARDITNEIF